MPELGKFVKNFEMGQKDYYALSVEKYVFFNAHSTWLPGSMGFVPFIVYEKFFNVL